MRAEAAIRPVIGARKHSRPPDEVIAALAARQHGVVSRRQLLAAGVGRRAIGHRLERARLHCVLTGVYAVGHPLVSRRGRWMAAVLSAGPGSALSHRSAAAHWGLLSPTDGANQVTCDRVIRSRRGLEVHRSALPADEVTVRAGIPVTTVPRTLLDLAAVVSQRTLERALNQAEVAQLGDVLSLEDLIARHPGRRGLVRLRGVLVANTLGTGVTRSELERRFLAFLDRHRLPRPELNAALHLGDRFIEADCLWRQQRLIVELDGRGSHGAGSAFHSDRARDRATLVAGWRTVRVTWRQLHSEPEQLAADLRSLLAAVAPGFTRSGRRPASHRSPPR